MYLCQFCSCLLLHGVLLNGIRAAGWNAWLIMYYFSYNYIWSNFSPDIFPLFMACCLHLWNCKKNATDSFKEKRVKYGVQNVSAFKFGSYVCISVVISVFGWNRQIELEWNIIVIWIFKNIRYKFIYEKITKY